MNVPDKHRTPGRDLRKRIGQLFSLPNAEHIVLGPSGNAMLAILFSRLGVMELIFTDEEYYGQEHFTWLPSRVIPVESIRKARIKSAKCAIVVSLVSWKGNRLPVESVFRDLRSEFGDRHVLILDYSHGGAIGFPELRNTTADIVLGDLNKWVLPMNWKSQFAFLWIRKKLLYASVRSAFLPLYLSVESDSFERHSRWLQIDDLEKTSSWISENHLDRSKLMDMHVDNTAFANTIATKLGIDTPVRTNILWIRHAAQFKFPAALVRRKILWFVSETETRVLCRMR